MFSLRPLDAKRGWVLLLLTVGLFGLADLEDEAREAARMAACSLGIACTLWMIWQLMRYDER